MTVRYWHRKHMHRWERDDGCVVKIDRTTECFTGRPWLPNYRGWMAYGPGDDEHNYLGFTRKRSPFIIPRKFKTPEAAMAAVDREYPFEAETETSALSPDGR